MVLADPRQLNRPADPRLLLILDQGRLLPYPEASVSFGGMIS